MRVREIDIERGVNEGRGVRGEFGEFVDVGGIESVDWRDEVTELPRELCRDEFARLEKEIYIEINMRSNRRRKEDEQREGEQ